MKKGGATRLSMAVRDTAKPRFHSTALPCLAAAGHSSKSADDAAGAGAEKRVWVGDGIGADSGVISVGVTAGDLAFQASSWEGQLFSSRNSRILMNLSYTRHHQEVWRS